jgi:hypothetical protein
MILHCCTLALLLERNRKPILLEGTGCFGYTRDQQPKILILVVISMILSSSLIIALPEQLPGLFPKGHTVLGSPEMIPNPTLLFLQDLLLKLLVHATYQVASMTPTGDGPTTGEEQEVAPDLPADLIDMSSGVLRSATSLILGRDSRRVPKRVSTARTPLLLLPRPLPLLCHPALQVLHRARLQAKLPVTLHRCNQATCPARAHPMHPATRLRVPRLLGPATALRVRLPLSQAMVLRMPLHLNLVVSLQTSHLGNQASVPLASQVINQV